MYRKGTLSTGVLLEANGLMPKDACELIAAGVDKDANGVSIDEGLKAKGTYFNFTPLAEANRTTFNNEIEIERKDYPLFEKQEKKQQLILQNTENSRFIKTDHRNI